jgi:hypothetical protein
MNQKVPTSRPEIHPSNSLRAELELWSRESNLWLAISSHSTQAEKVITVVT